MIILTEKEYDINESTDHCVYYTNLHHLVPVDQPDIEVSDPMDAGGDSSLPYVQVAAQSTLGDTDQARL